MVAGRCDNRGHHGNSRSNHHLYRHWHDRLLHGFRYQVGNGEHHSFGFHITCIRNNLLRTKHDPDGIGRDFLQLGSRWSDNRRCYGEPRRYNHLHRHRHYRFVYRLRNPIGNGQYNAYCFDFSRNSNYLFRTKHDADGLRSNQLQLDSRRSNHRRRYGVTRSHYHLHRHRYYRLVYRFCHAIGNRQYDPDHHDFSCFDNDL